MTNARFRRAAEADLLEAWVAIAESDMDAADRFLDRVYQTSLLLVENPAIGRTRSDIADGVRSFVCERHVIFYEIVDDGVVVLRVWHSARDPGSLDL